MRVIKAVSAPTLARLSVVGAVVGPAVDAIHNQVLLTYDVLPVSLGAASSSLLIPPLLALTYAILGGILPPLTQRAVGQGGCGQGGYAT